MSVEPTWREYLGRLLAERGLRWLISEALAISQVTLQRWVSGESPPRWRTLYRLLQIQMALQTNRILPVSQAEREVRQQLEQEFFQSLLEKSTCDYPIEEGSHP